jgi:hypothetical protein
VLGTVGFYTYIANAIPQVESDVPTELTFAGEVTAEQLVQAGDELYHGAAAVPRVTDWARARRTCWRTRPVPA